MRALFKKTLIQKAAIKLISSGKKFLLLYGGSRSGKTFIIIYVIIVRALAVPGSRHLILRYRFNHAKVSIWHDTLKKVLRLVCPDGAFFENKSEWFIEFMNGSQIWIGGLDDKDRTEKILGNEYATIYYNECSQMTWDAVETSITRLAQNLPGMKNLALFDCNPPGKRHWTHKLFIERKDPKNDQPLYNADLYDSMLLNPADNQENLPPEYIETFLATLSERKRQRFQLGLWTDDNENALWKYDWIDRHRVKTLPENFELVFIGVDPAVTNNDTSDETGIIVVARGPALDGMANEELEHFYVLDDYTLKASPAVWGKEVVKAYHMHEANSIIAETNNGGDLVESLIRGIDPNVIYKSVHATRGKMVRAEPVAALYERGLVHHWNMLNELESELTDWTPGDKSPNRLDALVWAISSMTQGAEAKARWL